MNLSARTQNTFVSRLTVVVAYRCMGDRKSWRVLSARAGGEQPKRPRSTEQGTSARPPLPKKPPFFVPETFHLIQYSQLVKNGLPGVCRYGSSPCGAVVRAVPVTTGALGYLLCWKGPMLVVCSFHFGCGAQYASKAVDVILETGWGRMSRAGNVTWLVVTAEEFLGAVSGYVECAGVLWRMLCPCT